MAYEGFSANLTGGFDRTTTVRTIRDYGELDQHTYTDDSHDVYGIGNLATGAAINTNSLEETNEYIARATDVFRDPNPRMIRRAAHEGPITYEQRIRVQYLQPPPAPEPGPLIIKEVRPRASSPPPALLIRQRGGPRPPTPPPLILRERPPTPPPQLPSETTTRYLPEVPVPPRSVVIERLPAPPEKPRDIIIERWLPYGPAPERRKVVEPAGPAPTYPEPRNTIVVYDAIEARVNRRFERLGVTRENPADYIARYGSSLLDSMTLVQRARSAGVHEDISPPASSSATYTGIRSSGVYEDTYPGHSSATYTGVRSGGVYEDTRPGHSSVTYTGTHRSAHDTHLFPE